MQRDRRREKMSVEKMIAEAALYVGTVEVGANNRGKIVDRFVKAVGSPLGSPWCAAFAMWCARGGGFDGDIAGAGACKSIYEYGVAHQLVVSLPARGDLVLFDFSDAGHQDFDHVGIIEKVVKLGPLVTLRTIEGNTRVANAKRDGVYRRLRVARRSSLIFVRLV